MSKMFSVPARWYHGVLLAVCKAKCTVFIYASYVIARRAARRKRIPD